MVAPDTAAGVAVADAAAVAHQAADLVITNHVARGIAVADGASACAGQATHVISIGDIASGIAVRDVHTRTNQTTDVANHRVASGILAGTDGGVGMAVGDAAKGEAHQAADVAAGAGDRGAVEHAADGARARSADHAAHVVRTAHHVGRHRVARQVDRAGGAAQHAADVVAGADDGGGGRRAAGDGDVLARATAAHQAAYVVNPADAGGRRTAVDDGRGAGRGGAHVADQSAHIVSTCEAGAGTVEGGGGDGGRTVADGAALILADQAADGVA